MTSQLCGFRLPHWLGLRTDQMRLLRIEEELGSKAGFGISSLRLMSEELWAGRLCWRELPLPNCVSRAM